MCNTCHRGPKNEFEEIPEEGIGWKIMLKKPEYYCKESGKIIWQDFYYRDFYWNLPKDEERGFCFFLTRAEAEKASKMDWLHGYEIQKIKYKQGIGSCLELKDGSWPPNTRFAMAKEIEFLGQPESKPEQ